MQSSAVVDPYSAGLYFVDLYSDLGFAYLDPVYLCLADPYSDLAGLYFDLYSDL